jgi:hypothetical protein
LRSFVALMQLGFDGIGFASGLKLRKGLTEIAL